MDPDRVRSCDVIVIGSGPVGTTVAQRTRAAGLSVVAVERELVGGECAYWACIPSKAMLRPVLAVADALRVEGARQSIGPVHAAEALSRRDGFVHDWNDKGEATWLESIGVELIRGHARLDGARHVVVRSPAGGDLHVEAKHAVAICTGTRPALPQLAGLDEMRLWTNRQATGSHDVPSELLIVWGGRWCRDGYCLEGSRCVSDSPG